MTKTTKKTKPDHDHAELERQIAEITADLQRTRADFENYRRRADADKQAAQDTGSTRAIMKLLPLLDTIERASDHAPEDIADHPWVRGVVGLSRQLEKALDELQLERIPAKPDTVFDPVLHQAVQFDEDSTGETEVICEELQGGYLLCGTTIRPAMVRVKRR